MSYDAVKVWRRSAAATVAGSIVMARSTSISVPAASSPTATMSAKGENCGGAGAEQP